MPPRGVLDVGVVMSKNAPGQGRPRKPTALRGIDGGKAPAKRGVAREVEPSSSRRVVRPVGMTAHARKVWDRVGPELIRLGVLTFLDVEAFRMYCEALATAALAAADVEVNGLTVLGSAGSVVSNPSVRIRAAAEDQAFRIGARFGLSPSDRAAIKVPSARKQGLAEFM